jgi:hypothetical protein
MAHTCNPKWVKYAGSAKVIRCATCHHRVLGDGTVANPWRCLPAASLVR